MKRLMFTTLVSVFWISLFFTFLFSPVVTHYFKKDSLNVFTWAGMVDPQVFKTFEEKTGIAVNVSYFGSNEELIVKLLATQARGYDLIIPSDYAVKFLIQHNLLQKLDKSKLKSFSRIDSIFLGHYFDRENEYSVPIEWYVLGCGVNKKLYKHGIETISWDSVFSEKLLSGERVGLINDVREVIGLAIFYLYKTFRPITPAEMQDVIKVLKTQKCYVEAYTDFRGDFLLNSGNATIAVVPSQFAFKSVKNNPNIEFVVPAQGTFLQLENCVIPKNSTQSDKVYQLIEFLLDPEIQRHNFVHATNFTTTRDADFLYAEPCIRKIFDYLHKLPRSRLLLFENFLSDEQVNEIWLAVKGS